MKVLSTAYHLDAQDRILWVSSGWHPFAIQNEAPRLGPEQVQHQPLWGFIATKEVRHLYDAMFERVRAGRRPLRVPFRCDGPECRRFMELEIVPSAEGELKLYSYLLREEQRERVSLLDVKQPRSDLFLTLCSWCKRAELEEEGWVEIEVAAAKLGLFGDEPLPQLSHGMCPDCLGPWLESASGGRIVR